MRHAMAAALAAGLVLTGSALAQGVHTTYVRLAELARQVDSGADQLQERLREHPGREGHVGERILRNLLTEAADDRDAQDPVFQRLVEAARDLNRAGRDLAASDIQDPEAERRFIHEFRDMDRVERSAEPKVSRSGPRRILIDRIEPALAEIRSTLPQLASFGERRPWRRHDDADDRD